MNSSRSIFKVTSIFASIQLVNVVLTIIRTKISAILIGVSGVGMVGIFINLIGLISGFTNFGIPIVGVQEISSTKNKEVITKRTLSLLFNITLLTGLLGSFIVLLFHQYIFYESFKRDIDLIWIPFLIFIPFFNHITAGITAYYQGKQEHSLVIRISLISGFLALVLNLTLFYFYGAVGIIPSMMLASMITSVYLIRKVRKSLVFNFNMKILKIVKLGKSILKNGFLVNIGGMLVLLVTTITQSVVNLDSGLYNVGLFNTAFTIINSYLGLVFISMSTEYFPRLSSLFRTDKNLSIIINQQILLLLRIISPMIIFLIMFSEQIINVLYSKEFLECQDLLLLLSIGIFFKVLSWPLAYVFLAAGNSKLFLKNEVIINAFILISQLIGYKLNGLEGIGYGFIISQCLYCLIVAYSSKINYDIRLFRNTLVQYFLFVLGILIIFYTFRNYSLYTSVTIFLSVGIFNLYLILNDNKTNTTYG